MDAGLIVVVLLVLLVLKPGLLGSLTGGGAPPSSGYGPFPPGAVPPSNAPGMLSSPPPSPYYVPGATPNETGAIVGLPQIAPTILTHDDLTQVRFAQRAASGIDQSGSGWLGTPPAGSERAAPAPPPAGAHPTAATFTPRATTRTPPATSTTKRNIGGIGGIGT